MAKLQFFEHFYRELPGNFDPFYSPAPANEPTVNKYRRKESKGIVYQSAKLKTKLYEPVFVHHFIFNHRRTDALRL